MTSIQTAIGPAGEILHIVPYAAPALPPVTKRDLEQAWQAARNSSLARHTPQPTPRFIRFTSDHTLTFTDRDAASWATAIDTIADLSTSHGISVCLRLLALIDLMARASWTRSYFSLTNAGAEIHPVLLQAAALSPLTETGSFAETALQELLPSGATQPESTE